MVRKDGAEARKERLQKVAQAIQGALHKEGEISLSKTAASLQYELGLTKERTQEYLEILEKLDHFVIDLEFDKIKKINSTSMDSPKC
jgi:hypothetical protein